MGVTAPIAALNDLIRKVEAIAGKGTDATKFRTGLLEQCAKTAGNEIENSFIESVDPYGKKWAPLKSRKGRILVNNGDLARSYNAQEPAQWTYTQTGFVVQTNVAYAPYHQYGAFVPPHSRIGVGVVFNAKGRFQEVRTKKGRAKVRSYWLGNVTYANGITIPRRQMVPEENTGGLGNWGPAINEEAAAFMKKWMSR